MAMSKKDFVALADSLSPVFGKDSPDDGFTKEEVLSALCGFMRWSNPRFMENRWRDYLAGKCGPNGGEIKGGSRH